MPLWHTGRVKRPHASDDVHERALAAVDDGHRVVDVAAMDRVNSSTLRRWRRQRDRTGSCRTWPRSGRPRRIGPVDEDALRAQVVAAPDATLAEHGARWQATQDAQVSVPTMGRLGITRKQRPSSPGSGMSPPGPGGEPRWQATQDAPDLPG